MCRPLLTLLPTKLAFLGVALIGALLSGCSDEAQPTGAAQGEGAGQASPRYRLVTLAPALTQMVIDLDMEDSLVGVAENDMVASPDLPVVGNYYQVNYEQLLLVKPTHVMIMVGSAGPPARLQTLAREGYFQLAVYPHPLSIQDVGRILYDEQTVLGLGSSKPANPCVGQLLGKTDVAGDLKYQMLEKLSRLSQLTSGLERPDVLIVIATMPTIMASGANTVNDQLLGYAGGVNVVGDASVTAPVFDRESLLALAPQVILIMIPNALELTDDDPRLASFRGLPIAAVENQRIVLLNDPMIVLPSTTLVQVAAQMAKAIHPSIAAQVDELLASLN